MRCRRSLTLAVLLFLAAWGLLIIRLGAPWFGHQATNGVWVSETILNYQRYGFLTVGGISIWNNAPATPDQFIYYTHRPIFPIWPAAAFVSLIGYSEAVVRFYFIAVTLLGAAAFFRLAIDLFGWRPAWWATMFYLLSPMILYLGRMPEHDPPALALLAFFGLFLFRWIKRPSNRHWGVLAVIVWFGSWMGWSTIFVFGVMGLLAMRLVPLRQRLRIVALGVVSLAAVVVYLIYYELRVPGSTQSLLDAFLFRSSNITWQPGSQPFTPGQFIEKIASYWLFLLTPGVIVLAVIGGAWIMKWGQRLQRAVFAGYVVAGVLYVLVFRNAAYIHDYYSIYVTPGLAIGAGGAYLVARRYHLFRPAFWALVSLFIVSGGFVLWQLHATHQPEMPLRLASLLHEQTRPQELILSNAPLNNISYGAAFYAGRDVVWEMSPEMAQAQSQPLVYLYCGDLTTLPASLMRAERIAETDGCALFRLSPLS